MRKIEEIKADIAAEGLPLWCSKFRFELLTELVGDIPLDRLEQLCQAEREQRAVVLKAAHCEFCEPEVCDGNPIFAIHASGYAGNGMYSRAGTPATLAHYCPKCGAPLDRNAAEAQKPQALDGKGAGV